MFNLIWYLLEYLYISVVLPFALKIISVNFCRADTNHKNGWLFLLKKPLYFCSSISKQNRSLHAFKAFNPAERNYILWVAPYAITLYHMIPQENGMSRGLCQSTVLGSQNPRVEVLGSQTRQYVGQMLRSCSTPLACFIRGIFVKY